ncbi:MAG: hypothetical protein M1821_005714 [Bathelium mastoideum]|nr:MAG: hypothetical protein M1821_005714 [Bathelium mastoideum]
MPLNPFTSQIPAQPTSSSRQYLPSRIKNPLVHSSSQGQNPSPHTGIPFETGPDRSSPPTHDPVPNGSVTKSADSHVPTTNPNVTPTLRGGPVKSNAATVGTDDGPPTKIPSVSVADPTAIIPIIVEGSRSGPGNNPAGGLPGTTTENPGNSISSEPHRAPENPGDHAGSAIAHIIGGHDTTAPAGPFLTSEFPNPKATSSGNVYGVSNGGPPAAPGTSFETAPIEMGGRHHSVIPSNGGDPTISSLPVIGGLTVAVNPVVSGGILIGHHSIARGGATTIAGTAVINGPHGAVVRASSTISSLSPGQTATIDSQTVIADASGKLVIGGSSIARGDATTVDGNVISNGFDGIVVGTSYTISVPSPAPVAPTDAKEASAVPTALFTLLGQTYIAKSGGPLVVDGKTLSPGNSATNVDGQTISVGSSGVVVYGSTIAYSAATDSILDVPATDIASSSDSIPDVTGSKTNPTAIFSFGSAREEMTYTDASGHVHTAVEGAVGGGTAIVDGSVTLTVGGRGTILEAETLSLASMGLVVNGSTKRFATAAVPSDPTSVISTLGVPDLPSGVDPTQTDTFSTAVKFELSCTWHLFILLYCVAFFAVNL